MSLIDLILSIAGLLLWVSWRYVPHDPINRARPATLTGTLRRAEPTRVRRWHFLFALLLLLIGRAFVYQWLGDAMQWAPVVKTGAVTIPFRSDMLSRMVLFSFASFANTLLLFYLSLILLWLAGPRNVDSDPCQRFVRIQLSPLYRWPRPLLTLIPLMVVAIVWLAVGPLLVRLQIVPKPESGVHLMEQAVVLGLSVYPVWKHLIGGILTLHLLNTYVYFGANPLWNFINATGKNTLKPLAWIPLRLGKMDFAPLAGIALAYALGGLAEMGLRHLFGALPI